MSFKTTFVLFGIVIVMLLVFGIALQVPRTTPEKTAVFSTLNDAIPIDTMVVDRGGKALRFLKSDRGWKMQEAGGSVAVRADETKVDDLLRQVRDAKRIEGVTVSNDLSVYGLDHPSEKVVLKERGAGREWTLFVGDRAKRPDPNFLYVTSSDRPREVMVLSSSSLSALDFTNPADMRARTLLDVNEGNTSYVRVTHAEDKAKKELAVQKNAEGLWIFKEPAAYGVADFAGVPAKKEPGVKDLLGDLAKIKVENVSDFEPIGNRPLADYGLAKGEAKIQVEAEVTSGAVGGKDKGVKEVLLVGHKTKDAKEKDKEYYYVRVEGDDGVARVPAKLLEPVLKLVRDPAALRSRDLTFVDKNNVDAAQLRWGEGLKTETMLLREDPSKRDKKADGKTHLANAAAITGDPSGLLAALKDSGKVATFLDAKDEAEGKKLDADYQLDKPQAEVKLYVNATEKKKAEPAKDQKKDGKEKETKKDESPEVQLKKDAKPAVTLLFGKVDKGMVYVKRVSEQLGTSRVAVPADLLKKVAPANGYLAFLDRSLPSFPFDKVTRLEVDRGKSGGKFVIELAPEKEPEKDKGKAGDKDKDGKKDAKKDKGPKWLLLEPKDLPDRPGADTAAVEDLLGVLERLQVEKWVRKVDPKDAKAKEILGSFGLEPADLTVSVTVKKPAEKDKGTDKDKAKEKEKEKTGKEKETKEKEKEITETYVYRFGKEVSDEDVTGVYALLEQKDDPKSKDLVFLAQPQAVKELREKELRDRTIFTFDAAKAKDVKMVGWFAKVKVNLTLQANRKPDNSWAATQPEKFDLDNRRFEDFVKNLSHLEAKRFVAFKKEKKEDLKEYGLTSEDPTLRIDVNVEDPMAKEGKTYQLTVGALNGDKTGYYAMASTLPGVVFLVPKEEFEPVVNEIAYFSRTRQAAAK
jgi:hypothetical protein